MFDHRARDVGANFIAAFVGHSVAAVAISLFGAIAAGLLGMLGNVSLLIAVAVVAMLGGTFVAKHVDGSKAKWSWIPGTLWFAGWVIPTLLDSGEPHFERTFIGNGYCGDFSCMGQVFVTAPFIGSVVYAWAARVAAKDRSRAPTQDGRRTTDQERTRDQAPTTRD